MHLYVKKFVNKHNGKKILVDKNLKVTKCVKIAWKLELMATKNVAKLHFKKFSWQHLLDLKLRWTHCATIH